jgi:hypothetical protein
MNTRTFLLSLLLAFLASGSILDLKAAESETRFAAELVWGTSGDKPPDQELKPITPELKKRLQRVFKWRNYFQIARKEFVVSPTRGARVQMSRDCVLEVAALAGGDFEIQLFGKGVLVVKKKQPIIPGETIVLGGDDKNDNAWFVVLNVVRPDRGR